MPETIGILDIQGGVELHTHRLSEMGLDVRRVKTEKILANADRLILPGGESSTMHLLLNKHGLWPILQDYCQHQPVLGTCAGAILLAKITYPNHQAMLNAIDITVNRNFYGSQLQSQATEVTTEDNNPLPIVFIRAPQIAAIGPGVEVLARYNEDPIWVKSKRVMVTTFHPELTDDERVYRQFLTL